MSEDLKDILSNLNPDVDQETLLQYLQGKLSAQDQHDLEKQMMDMVLMPKHWKVCKNLKTRKVFQLW